MSRSAWVLVSLLALNASSAKAAIPRPTLDAGLASGDARQIAALAAAHPEAADQTLILQELRERLETGREPDSIAMALAVALATRHNVDDALTYVNYYRAVVSIDGAVCAGQTSAGSLLEGSIFILTPFLARLHPSTTELRASVDRAIQLEAATAQSRRVDPSLCGQGLTAYLNALGVPLTRTPPPSAGASWSPNGRLYSADPIWRQKRAQSLPLLKNLLLAMYGLPSGEACSGGCTGDVIKAVNFPYALRATKRLTWDGEISDPLPRGGAFAPAAAVAWSVDGAQIAAAVEPVADLTRLQVWSDASQPSRRYDHRADLFTLTPPVITFVGGSLRMVGTPPASHWSDHEFPIWDPITDSIEWSSGEPKPASYNDGHWQGGDPNFAPSPDGALMAVWSNASGPVRNSILSLYAVSDWTFLRYLDLGFGASSVGWFRDGRLAVGTNDGRIALLDSSMSLPPRVLQLVDKPKFGPVVVSSVSPSPDGKFIFARLDAQILSGNIAQDPAAMAWEQSTRATVVVRSVDGVRVAAFPVEKSAVSKAAWDRRGRFVAFVDGYGAVTLWRPLATPPSYASITPPDLATTFSISPDGGRIAAGTGSGVSVYSVSEAQRQVR